MPMQVSTGPHRDYMGFGATMNALIGFNHLTGYPEREPVGTGTNYPDHVPNPCHAAFAVIAALRYRNRTGKGQAVEVAQTESALSVLAMAIMDMANNQRVQTRMGNEVSYAAPHGVYPCKGEDRWCVLACSTEKEWKSLLQVPELAHLAHDPRFRTLTGRIKYRKDLDALIARWTKQYPPEEVMNLLQEKGVPAGVVQNAKDLIENDPQLRHRKHFVKLYHPEMGESIYNNTPFKLSKTPSKLKTPAPLLGQHTEYVCKKLIGLSDEEFQQYVSAGVFK
jgi:crotonobetainyl-CoA:carnitine CoA-transferase CaiB-like acyl-CoA transferase